MDLDHDGGGSGPRERPIGTGWTYGAAACRDLIADNLAGVVTGRDAFDVPGAYDAMGRARNIGRLGRAACRSCNDVPMQPSLPPVSDAAVQALMLASRAFVGLAARSLAAVDGDVTLPQFRTLVVLAVRGPQRSIDIAEELRVNPSTGTRMCDRLVRKGLVRRMRSTTDRRVVRLRLTPDGHDLVEQVIRRRREDLVRLVAATADLWQPVVTDALTAFAEAAGEIGEHDWWLGWSAHAEDAAEPAPTVDVAAPA